MNKNILNKVYIISGPAGVGKSTTSKELAKKIKNSAYISGDDISHMHINGRKNPWERSEEVLIWDNILSLTKNFIKHGIDVIIDYVTFPKEADWVSKNLKSLNVEVIYIVLWTDKETLLTRDNMRMPGARMGERCVILVDEFIESGLNEQHILDTSNNSPDEISFLINETISNEKYKLES
ncbi:AAA family ATPase [Solibacillus sp. FSL R5-0449]|uniref:AAA family ATPase n=1 Tax=Solibacillus sp. FSL R5-0449 TaxID=2921639 RepID=UPI0030D5C9F1